MGKRKERRLAAQSNAGRRVKLDLFAEPSGDLGGSTEHDEVGGDKDSNNRDGLPNSPTSSGQQPQNPLLLLGQYSDEELDEETNKELNNTMVECSSPYDEVKPSLDEECDDLDVNTREDSSVEKAKQQEVEQEPILPDFSQNLEGSDRIESNPITSGDLRQEMDMKEQNADSGASDVQVTGDVSFGWKIVMHEESNQCYYWNTETGETSWEVPDVLAQATGLTNGQTTECAPTGIGDANIISGAIMSDSSAVHLYEGGTMGAKFIPHGVEVYGHVYQMNDGSEAWKDSTWNTDAKPRELVAGSEGHESGVDPSHLVKQTECLLERLKSLEGSKDHIHSYDWLSKYILEVEIRLTDLQSLAPYGLSLLPFWVYSEKQLKRMESAISDEISRITKSALKDEVKGTHVSTFSGSGKLEESMSLESETDGTEPKAVLSTFENYDVAPYVDTSVITQKDSCSKAPLGNAEHVPSSGDTGLRSGAVAGDQVNGTKLGDESNHQHVFNAAEDIDMDVDMEVEDATSSGNTNAVVELNPTDVAPLEHPIPPNSHSDYPSLVSEDAFTVPPPPDEEWIPPPPPDNELIPPPPPDEPPEPSCPPPPSYMEIGQPLSYTDPYNLSYTNCSFQYNGHSVAHVPGSNLYGHADGSQVSVPGASTYYDAVTNTFTDTASVMVHPVQPVAYYELQDGTVPPVPVVSLLVSSGFQSESAPVGYETFPSEQILPVNSYGVMGCNSLANVDINVSAVGGETDKTSIEVPSTSATIGTTAMISEKESFPVPPTDSVSAATVAATSVGAKVQSKVLRSKKRTTAVAPSLRSNKKVSSLVDKWKAAKEELLEDEKEPEDAYEILERKRQREIEEWRARQIATGEAKDNANFQPLGGDWRERVKRRRAQLAKEAVQTPPEVHTDRNQPPDLIGLSKDLPSGWQAYWDESSKQVYYGNSNTSDTTWIRPTK